MTVTMTKAQAGRLGGSATLKKYGREYMRTIGKAGASAFWKKYFLSPVGMANFAIVSKETNKVIGFTSPDQWRQS